MAPLGSLFLCLFLAVVATAEVIDPEFQRVTCGSMVKLVNEKSGYRVCFFFVCKKKEDNYRTDFLLEHSASSIHMRFLMALAVASSPSRLTLAALTPTVIFLWEGHTRAPVLGVSPLLVGLSFASNMQTPGSTCTATCTDHPSARVRRSVDIFQVTLVTTGLWCAAQARSFLSARPDSGCSTRTPALTSQPTRRTSLDNQFKDSWRWLRWPALARKLCGLPLKASMLRTKLSNIPDGKTIK